jgi:hypothetical protein
MSLLEECVSIGICVHHRALLLPFGPSYSPFGVLDPILAADRP